MNRINVLLSKYNNFPSHELRKMGLIPYDWKVTKKKIRKELKYDKKI